MPHRFYAPGAAPGERIALDADEAEHLRRVLRLRVNDEVHVFDGRGHEFAARVAAIDRDGVTVAIGEPAGPARETRTPITLVQAVLKGDKMDGVIRDAVMLGVRAIQPLIATRTDGPAPAAARAARWTRIALSSTKQSGRAQLARIDPPRTLDEWLMTPRPASTIMAVEPGARTDGVRPLREAVADRPVDAAVLVGPEGGWTPDEIACASEAGATLVTLGDRTLRADAVPLVLLSMLLFAWD